MYAGRIIHEVDIDHDGRVQFNEINKNFQTIPKKTQNQIDEIKYAFKFLSGDTKKISKQQLRDILKEAAPNERCEILLTSLDFDHEGYVNYEDAINTFYSFH